MSTLYDSIFKYGYHDSVLTSIKTENNTFCLFFEQGLYTYTSDGNEDDKTGPIKMFIEIDNELTGNIMDVVSVVKYNRRGRHFIDAEDFINNAKIKDLTIFDLYFSRFDNTIMIEAFWKDSDYLIRIEECKNVFYKTEI